MGHLKVGSHGWKPNSLEHLERGMPSTWALTHYYAVSIESDVPKGHWLPMDDALTFQGGNVRLLQATTCLPAGLNLHSWPCLQKVDRAHLYYLSTGYIKLLLAAQME